VLDDELLRQARRCRLDVTLVGNLAMHATRIACGPSRTDRRLSAGTTTGTPGMARPGSEEEVAEEVKIEKLDP
jgi:hypothetical protein